MQIFSRVPLAWLNLTHDKLRLVTRVGGMTFAVFLLFVERGFWDALLEAPVQLIRQLNGELIVVSRASYSLAIKETFPRLCLVKMRGLSSVKDVFPVYLEHPRALWKEDAHVSKRQRSASQPIRVIAFNLSQPVLKDDVATADDLAALKVPFNILLDRKSKPKSYGAIERDINPELAGHTVHVADTFVLGTDFANDGNVIMSAETFALLFGEGLPPESALEMVDMGVVQIAQGAKAQEVCAMLRQTLPEEVRIYTTDDFIQREQNYWEKTTPMGFIFLLGLIVGVAVGIVICYQIISTDVSEHLPQFATLKAMGYSDAYLNGVVLREALCLGMLGFAFGLGLSKLAYMWLSRETGLPMELRLKSFLIVLLSTIFMCVASGIIALRRVRTADPAEVFA